MLYDPKWKRGGGWLWPNRAWATVAMFVVMFGPAILVGVATMYLPGWLWLFLFVTLMVGQQKLFRGIKHTYARNGWM